MNKYLLLVAFFVLGFAQATTSQEVRKVTKDSEENKEISSVQKFRHWSIAWNGGMSIIDADVSGNNKIVPNSFINFAFNAQKVEKTAKASPSLSLKASNLRFAFDCLKAS